MSGPRGVLTICLDAYRVIVDPQFPSERKIEAHWLLRARLPELGTKDTDQYYKSIPAIRERYMGGGPAGDGVDQGVEVEVASAALPDPGLDWSF